LKHAKLPALLLAPLALAALADERAAPKEAEVNLTPGAVTTPEIVAGVLAADAAFFAAVFDTCGIETVRGFVTEDFEFFHDKYGLVFTSGPAFVKGIEEKCARQRDGVEFLSRRELVRDSVKVYALDNYGAIEIGVHRFYALSEGKPDRLTETGQFTHVWKQEGDGKWRLARVLSYDHRLAQ
jgi:hypothetical protein